MIQRAAVNAAFIHLIFFLATGITVNADPVKRGKPLCEGAKCNLGTAPAGANLGNTWDAVQDFGGRVSRRIDIAIQPTAKKQNSEKVRAKTDRRIGKNVTPSRASSNLPIYYSGIDRSTIVASDNVLFEPKSSDPKLKGLKSGDVVWAVVEQEITASPQVPTPIRAIATAGAFKGAYFVGEASLVRELKRVLFTFNKLRLKDSDLTYALKAAGLSPRGSIGLEGEYVSQTGRFFIAELASAAAAGFVDSTIHRNQTALGTYTREPTVSNSGKAAAVTALSKTTERMADQARTAPEFTRLEGYQEIQIIIQDDPVEAGT